LGAMPTGFGGHANRAKDMPLKAVRPSGNSTHEFWVCVALLSGRRSAVSSIAGVATAYWRTWEVTEANNFRKYALLSRNVSAVAHDPNSRTVSQVSVGMSFARKTCPLKAVGMAPGRGLTA
jgi:hypothetical protein